MNSASNARTCIPLPQPEFAVKRLDEVVARNNKQRFSLDPTGTLIRSNQGHSVDVDLHLQPTTPPSILYHGTAQHLTETIALQGPNKMKHHHIHLSADLPTALTVGARHGRPVVFEADAGSMARDGYVFYRSENGVWLVDRVPPGYLRLV